MRHVVFYDARCPFCYYLKKTLRRLDWRKKIKWVSIQEVEKSEGYPYLKGRNISEEIHLLTNQGQVAAGFDAVRLLLLQLPPVSIFGLLSYLPPVNLIGPPFYRWFSSHRYEWFGQYESPRYD
ncbi:thiol-disulfide oxidoreductase DCC family protein [Halobacillus sp. Marseille-Q1614]|uniref:thiol-disulfide oxidoreductase DCC family protein n=1 Tax=Halobacillus sp. Marseille-Q1614 TaxID=2709134 RepID=UPI00157030A4|nr:DUF393 domain-containing protein [Halobacillus sp. Marseille-Q1614]